MHDFFTINRNALITRPTPALIDWVNSVFPEDPVRFEDLGQHDSQDVFLIPDFDSVEESLEWIRENCEEFLSYSLEDWCTDQSAWPQPLDWPLFEKFFEFSILTAVVDTMEGDYDSDDEDFEDVDMDDFDFEDN
ncbi:MAG: hypothetical protein KDD02_25125 [Phaeodactylibacter sp.]|nr:hypothetical protein [Phaeodactylibacter sp.]